MMGFGSFGGGGSSLSPSASNLSALAPPFTVDRSNSKPSAASLLQFSESPYTTSFGHTWQYANPAASRPDGYQKSELEADSRSIASVTSACDYHFRYSVPQSDNTHGNHWSTLNSSAKTSTDAFLFDPKGETYYPRYVPPAVDEGTPLVALSDRGYDVLPPSGIVSANASAQVDYTQSLSGLEYSPNWGGVCYGVVDAKRGKHAKLDGSFATERSSASDSVAYTNYLDQGCNIVQCENMADKDSGSSYRQFSDVMGRESSKHLTRVEHADNISPLVQKVLSPPFDSSMTSISSSSFTMSESLPPGPSLPSPKNFSNYQNPYNPYGNGNRPINSCFGTSVSVTKSSPTLVIRPPPVGTGLASQKSSSGQSVDLVDVDSVHQNAGWGNQGSAKGKEPQVLQISEGVEGSFYTSNIKNHKDEIEKLFSLSSVVEGPPSKVQNKDTLSPVLRMNSGCQFLNVNTTDGSSLPGDIVLAIKSSEPAVDSPCWKGAPSSHFAPFDAVEPDSSYDFVKKLDECHCLDRQVQPPFPSLHDPIRSPYEKVAKDKVQDAYGSAATEQLTADMAKGIPILTSTKGVQFCEESSKAGEEYKQLDHSKSDSLLQFSDQKQLGIEEYNFATKKPNLQAAVMDTVMSVNDSTEGGDIAVRAAENVLCSPSSEESASEQVKPHKSESTPKIDVQTLISAMQNLSDLLVFGCSSNECALKEQEREALKHVISNLDSLLPHRMVYMTQGKEPMLHLHPHKNIGTDKPQFENKAPLISCGELDYEEYCHEKKSGSFVHFPSLTNDVDILDDDTISQAIKKVLDENSYFGEEGHSQALLFKNLWLEAEAKLYSISYRTRFQRMKIEIERLKSKQVKDITENIATPLKSSRSETFHAPSTSISPPPDVEKVSRLKTALQGSSSNPDNVEASVIAQLHMLSCCDDPKPTGVVPEQQANDVEASVMTRFHILKHRDDLNTALTPVAQQADTVHAVCSDDSVTQSPGNSGKRTQYSIGSTDNSSDWEHVLKEDISWR